MNTKESTMTGVNLSSSAQAALEDAGTMARRYRQEFIEAEHVLLAMMLQDNGLVPALLRRLRADVTYLARQIERRI